MYEHKKFVLIDLGSEMHLQSLKLLAMSETVLELRKCITTVPNLARYVLNTVQLTTAVSQIA
jgi:hypothetical protein